MHFPRSIVLLTIMFILCGCMEASHELLPSSSLPRGIVHDPRLRGMGPVRVVTDSYTGGTIVATIISREHRGRFKIRGTIAALEPPHENSDRWRETYNGETDIFEYYRPDYHYVRIVRQP